MALLDHDRQVQFRQSQQRRPDALLQPVNDNRRDLPEPDQELDCQELDCQELDCPELDCPELDCPELDCLVGVLPPNWLRDAATRARQLGTGADRVLIASGAIGEGSYLRHFARHTGIGIWARGA